MYQTIARWWGRKDSNLRSHEAADLQSAPFATRDTPPSNNVRSYPPEWRRTESWMTLITTDPVRGARPARLWAKGDSKVNQGNALIGILLAVQIAIIRNP
jgi:hypothetical protein